MENFPPYPRLPHPNGGQARIRVDGKQVYLGKFASPESILRYDKLRDDWLRRKSVDCSTLTIDDLALRFLEYATDYYVKNGVPTSEVDCIRAALPPLVKRYGPTLAGCFGPLRLKKVREDMIAQRWIRTAINRQIKRIVRAFGWAVENELLAAGNYEALKAVRGLAKGRTTAAEGEPVKPVPLPFFEAIQPHVSRQVWGMARLQLLTGARPGEVVSMRIGDLNTSGRIWEYTPRSHKSEHRDSQRLILIGPKAQAIVREFLKPCVEAFVFSPVEADTERQAARRAARKSPMTPSHAARRPKTDGRRRPKDHYTVASYRRAIVRACIAANVPEWHPHQLRHNAATELRRMYGVEAARVILGHASLDATEIYAEADLQRARQIAVEIG
jgi:integrase